MVHQDYKELIPAHALSALDASDERELSEHLADCEECRGELADWEATAASLALTVDPIEPPAQVRASLLSKIGSDKSASNVVPFGPPSRTFWQSLGSLGSIAAVVLFAALIVFVVVLYQQNRTRIVELAGTPAATGATAKLTYDNTGRALLATSGLPRAPEGKEYQLWFIVGDKPLPGKTFNPDNGGRSLTTDEVPEAARKSAVFAVTLEPAGGVQSPTGAIYLRGEL